MTYEFETSDLKKTYLSKTALDGISLKIEKGSMTFLLGSNGSGKSTLLKCLAGHQYWDSGKILRQGRDRDSDHDGYNRGLQFISEDIQPPALPLKDLRDLYREIYTSGNGNGKNASGFDDALFSRLIEISGIKMTQNLTGVSRGQKVQGLLALALATKPETLLIDEATAVLDPYVRGAIIKEIDALNRTTGMTLLLATNLANEIVSLRGRVIVLRGGKVVDDRTADKINMDEILATFEKRVIA